MTKFYDKDFDDKDIRKKFYDKDIFSLQLQNQNHHSTTTTRKPSRNQTKQTTKTLQSSVNQFLHNILLFLTLILTVTTGCDNILCDAYYVCTLEGDQMLVTSNAVDFNLTCLRIICEKSCAFGCDYDRNRADFTCSFSNSTSNLLAVISVFILVLLIIPFMSMLVTYAYLYYWKYSDLIRGRNIHEDDRQTTLDSANSLQPLKPAEHETSEAKIQTHESQYRTPSKSKKFVFGGPDPLVDNNCNASAGRKQDEQQEKPTEGEDPEAASSKPEVKTVHSEEGADKLAKGYGQQSNDNKHAPSVRANIGKDPELVKSDRNFHWSVGSYDTSKKTSVVSETEDRGHHARSSPLPPSDPYLPFFV